MRSNNNLIEFFQTIKKDRENRKLNRQSLSAAFEMWDFQIIANIVRLGIQINPPRKRSGIVCITLDSDDIEYLTKKYRPQLEEELKEKKQELENKYKDI